MWQIDFVLIKLCVCAQSDFVRRPRGGPRMPCGKALGGHYSTVQRSWYWPGVFLDLYVHVRCVFLAVMYENQGCTDLKKYIYFGIHLLSLDIKSSPISYYLSIKAWCIKHFLNILFKLSTVPFQKIIFFWLLISCQASELMSSVHSCRWCLCL